MHNNVRTAFVEQWKWRTDQVVWADPSREWVPAEDAEALKEALEFFLSYPETYEAKCRAAAAVRLTRGERDT